MRIAIALLFILALSLHVDATTIRVPQDQATIQTGINAAVNGDTVLVAAGTYGGGISFGGKAIVVRSMAGATVTIIEPDQGATAVSFTSNEHYDSVLDGFGINGNLRAQGIWIEGARPLIQNCVIEQCNDFYTTGRAGGAIGACTAGFWVRDCQFNGNQSYSNSGIIFGFTEGEQPDTLIDTTRIERCTFVGGPSLSTSNAVRLYFSRGLIVDCFFTNNNGTYSQYGGAVFLADGRYTVSGCLFQDNTAINGGGLMVNQATVDVVSCDFISNIAVAEGGGCSVWGGDVRFINCQFSENSAVYGGALAVGCTFEIFGCLFNENVAQRGGAIYCFYVFGSLQSSTFYVNAADTGASIFLRSTDLELTECIVARSINSAAVFIDRGPTSAAVVTRCSDFFMNASGDWLGPDQPVMGLDGNFSADPSFCDATLANFAISWQSPCVPGNSPCDSLIGAFAPSCGFVSGDADGSGVVTISDVVFLINYIFSGGPAPSPLSSGDADCSEAISISDAVYLINYIFAGGPPPCEG